MKNSLIVACCLVAMACENNGSPLASQVSAESQAVAQAYLQVKDLPEFKDALKSFRGMTTQTLVNNFKEIPDNVILRGKTRTGLRPTLTKDYSFLAKNPATIKGTLGDAISHGAGAIDDLTATDVERYYTVMEGHLKGTSAAAKEARSMKGLSAAQMRRSINAAILIDMVNHNEASGLNLYKWKFRWSDLTTPGLIVHIVEMEKCKRAEGNMVRAKIGAEKAQAATEKIISDVRAAAEKTKADCAGIFPNFACGDNHPDNLDKIGRPEKAECRDFEYACKCTLTDRNNTPPCNLNWQGVGANLMLAEASGAGGAAPASAATANPAEGADPNELPTECK